MKFKCTTTPPNTEFKDCIVEKRKDGYYYLISANQRTDLYRSYYNKRIHLSENAIKQYFSPMGNILNK